MNDVERVSYSREGIVVPVHPGRLLKREMAARGLSTKALASALHVPAKRISAILKERRAISADTALRLGRYLGTGPEVWLGMQRDYDVAVVLRDHGAQIEADVKPAE
ncbi:HigA family addiction module antitoxin [Roseospira marina]|uniref:HigA family addiction module antitoxin n=1 Tax=Roseospira marina TaxID=140057 RepID=UPI0017D88DEF|nr:HigA family addiction module antitoxin [Roseospira marina]MBB4315151.1 addiction module HigA family antidote [Roseospira marina]